MKSSDLHNLWTAPDNSRITSKQFSFRLPVHVAAKLAAIAEMYPQKTRTEIVGDLLATALDELVKGMPFIKGRSIGFLHDPDEEIFEDLGPSPRFWALADKYYKELEKEMGNDNPPSLQKAMRTPKNIDNESTVSEK
jgi:hypothetical protein